MEKIICGDCFDVMAGMDENSIDAIVTDPPYGLKFMGKDWDHGVPGKRYWEAVLRVAKPGAHLLAFGGTRTFHRLACAIEDAGWEIRDTLGWIYGSGFPKSLDVSKAIDKMAGAKREVIGTKLGQSGMAKDGSNQRSGFDAAFGGKASGSMSTDITAPATEAAKKWDGWGTALKPAWEPIIMARKPFKNTVAGNVLEWGTGAINIDGCRVDGEPWKAHRATGLARDKFFTKGPAIEIDKVPHVGGRWPANLIHDGSDEALEVFPETGKSSGGTNPVRKENNYQSQGGMWKNGRRQESSSLGGFGDNGSAARFFYCAKASKSEREEDNRHPTVKPLDLMCYLCRLVTPPSGIVFDPFMGSGSTGVAAIQEGFEFIGCDIKEEYCLIAKKRIGKAIEKGVQLSLDV